MRGVDHYKALSVDRDATQEEIKSAFRREALRWHPDRNPGDRDAEGRFKAVREAYEALRDPQKRRSHDAEVAGYGRDAPHAGASYGRGMGRRCRGGRGRRCGRGRGAGSRRWASAIGDIEDRFVFGVSLSPLEAVLGCRKRVLLKSQLGTQVLDIRLPPGLVDGDVVQLVDAGLDLQLRVNIGPVV